MLRITLTIITVMLMTGQSPAEAPSLKLVLEENFDGSKLNESIWNIETGPRKAAINTQDSVDVEAGLLKITTWTGENNSTFCGFVTTKGKIKITKGAVEVRCRYSLEPGTQAAFWVMSDNYGKSGLASLAWKDGVEIDVIETHGLMDGEFQNAIHWGPYKHPTEKKVEHQHYNKSRSGKSWQRYGVDFSGNAYRFTRNGQTIWTTSKPPLTSAPQYLILSSESIVSGWSGVRPKGGYGNKTKSKNVFEVDWVKAWTSST
jgi:hypothetical protein